MLQCFHRAYRTGRDAVLDVLRRLRGGHSGLLPSNLLNSEHFHGVVRDGLRPDTLGPEAVNPEEDLRHQRTPRPGILLFAGLQNNADT